MSDHPAVIGFAFIVAFALYGVGYLHGLGHRWVNRWASRQGER